MVIDVVLRAWLNVGVPAVAIGLLARGVWVLVALAVVRRGVLAAGAPTSRVPVSGTSRAEAPTVVILLPMLREQSVVAEAIDTMASLPYPEGRAVVCVITTAREERAKATLREQVAALNPDHLTPARMRGLFPAVRAPEILAHLATVPAEKRTDELLRRFDEEPTTAEVVDELLASQASRGNPDARLPVVHLHQPPEEGGKASQLNFALAHLDTLLGAAGQGDRENTYVLVYDADAIPDRGTLSAIANLARRHAHDTGSRPGMIQQHRLPTRLPGPLPGGPTGFVLAAEWIMLVRRCLAIEWARLLLSERVARWPRGLLRTLVQPVVYGVGCGMTVRVPELTAIGGFPEPMEDVGGGFRLSLQGASMLPLRRCVADETYTDLRSVVNLHGRVYCAYRRPARHRGAVAGVSRLNRVERTVLVNKIRVDIAAWLVAAPVCLAAAVSAAWLVPGWLAVMILGGLLWGPAPTVVILTMRGALSRAAGPAGSARTSTFRWSHRMVAVLVLLSPLFQWIEMIGGWRMAALIGARRPVVLAKTER
ncbi:hypothetical protein [Micromonospora sp. RP3T]|uniref:hypothetical protein n=1 Tax=Micromonospora sp. RP3T TaxID=2135446 RepID=UPI003D709E1D